MRWLVGLVLAVSVQAGEAWSPPEDIMPRLREVVRDAVAHGLPDLAVGELRAGRVSIAGIAPMGLSFDQRMFDFYGGGRDSKTGVMLYQGVHLQLPDGGWLALGSMPILPGDGCQVTAQTVGWSVPAGPLENAYDALEGSPVEPDLRRWCRWSGRIDELVSRASGQPSVMGAVLVAKDLPGADRFVVQQAICHVVNLRLRRLVGRGPDPVLRVFPDRILDDQYESGEVYERARHLAPITWADLDPVADLRRGLVHCWLSRAMRGHGAVPALAEVRRLVRLLPGDQTVPTADEIDRLERGLVLDVPAHPSDLASRLIAWAPPAARPMLRPKDLATAGDRFSAADLPTIARLVGDTRPSRWISRHLYDNGQPHPNTLGDNALRAMGDVLHLDPRWLVGVDPAVPWNDAGRARTATALTALLPEGAVPDPAVLIAGAVPRLRCHDLAYALSGLAADRRAPVVDAIAAAWRSAPDLRRFPDHEDVATVLALAGPHPGLRAAVAAWGATAGNAPVCALYLANLGDGGLLDQLAAEVPVGVAKGAVPGSVEQEMAGYQLTETLVALASHPTPARLDAMLAWPGKDARRMVRLLDHLGLAWSGSIKLLAGKAERGDQLVPGFVTASLHQDWPSSPARDLASEAMVLAVVAVALADTRPDPTETTGDLRICDQAASALARWPYEVRLLMGAGANPTFDLDAPLMARDQVIADWRQVVTGRATRAFTQAGLPHDRLPAPTPPISGF